MNKKMENNKKDMRAVAMKVMMSFMTFSLLLWNSGFYCQAANYGEKVGTWALDQLFWVGVVVLAVALIGCAMKRAWVAAIIMLVGGGIILAFIKEPTLIQTIGTTIVDTIFK